MSRLRLGGGIDVFVRRCKPISFSTNTTECRFLTSVSPLPVSESASWCMFATEAPTRCVQDSSPKVWAYSTDSDGQPNITSSTLSVAVNLTSSASASYEHCDNSLDPLLRLTNAGRTMPLARANTESYCADTYGTIDASCYRNQSHF